MCTCAINQVGTKTTILSSIHADEDPCFTKAQVTGRRRKGTIRNGGCSNCGYSNCGWCEDKHDFQGCGAELFIMRCKHCRLSLTDPMEIKRLQGKPCNKTKEQMGWNTGAQTTY